MERAHAVLTATPWLDRLIELLASGGQSFLVAALEAGWRKSEEMNFAAVAELRMAIEAEECGLGPTVDLAQYNLYDMYAMLGGWLHERWQVLISRKARRELVLLACETDSLESNKARDIRQVLAGSRVPAQSRVLLRKLVDALSRTNPVYTGLESVSRPVLPTHASPRAMSPLMMTRVDSRNFTSVADLVGPLLFATDARYENTPPFVSVEQAQIAMRFLVHNQHECLPTSTSSSESSPSPLQIGSILPPSPLVNSRRPFFGGISSLPMSADMPGASRMAESPRRSGGVVVGKLERPLSPPHVGSVAMRQLEEQIKDLRDEVSQLRNVLPEQGKQQLDAPRGFDFWTQLLLSESNRQLRLERAHWGRLERRLAACEGAMMRSGVVEREEKGVTGKSEDQYLEMFQSWTGVAVGEAQAGQSGDPGAHRTYHYSGQKD